MEKTIKQLITAYFILIVIKTILASLIPAPSAFADDYTYIKMARSFFISGEFSIHGVLTSAYPPLYPIIISLSYIFNDMNLVYFFMKFINVILITSIIFPSYLIAKEFLPKKDSFLVSLLISFIPSIFAFPVYIMAESLFYPLFLFAVYFLYKSFIEKSYLWDILAGLFIGLLYLTKVIGVAIIPVVLVSFIACSIYNKKQFIFQLKKKLVLGCLALLTILPWILRNIRLYGFSFKGIMGSTISSSESVAALSGKYTFEVFATMFIFYLTFFVLSSGILFFISSFSTIKKMLRNNKLFTISTIFISSLLFFILIAVNHNSAVIKHITLYPWLTGKFIGRYVDPVLPLFFILGFIGYKYLKKDKKIIKILIFLAPLLIFSSQIIYLSLYPINNLSLTWIGVLNYFLNYILYSSTNFMPLPTLFVSFIFAFMFVFFVIISIYIPNKFSLRKILPYFMIFFLINSLLSLGVIYYDSNRFWHNGEQTKLGLWFNEYDKDKFSTILFDIRDGDGIDKYNQTNIYGGKGTYTIIGFWMNDEISIGDIKDAKNKDYIVSRHILEYPVLYKTKNGVFLYKVN